MPMSINPEFYRNSGNVEVSFLLFVLNMLNKTPKVLAPIENENTYFQILVI